MTDESNLRVKAIARCLAAALLADVDGAVNAHCSQHRRSPSMVPILACTPEFHPYLLANLLRGLNVFFHFSAERWLAKCTSLPLSAKLSGVKSCNK